LLIRGRLWQFAVLSLLASDFLLLGYMIRWVFCIKGVL
jgi:hypothetical protein